MSYTFKPEYAPGEYIERIIFKEFLGCPLEPLDGAMPVVPFFSRIHSDAWLVLTTLLKRLPQHDLHLEHLQGVGWSASTCYERHEGGWEHWVTGETFEHTVALAALQFLGYHVMQDAPVV